MLVVRPLIGHNGPGLSHPSASHLSRDVPFPDLRCANPILCSARIQQRRDVSAFRKNYRMGAA